MTRFDLHPEDLIERADRGSATAAEIARLEQHLAECAVCRVERALKAQAERDAASFRDEQLSLARVRRQVTARRHEPEPRRSQRQGAALAALLLAGSLASVAAAAALVVVRTSSPRESVATARSPSSLPKLALPRVADAPSAHEAAAEPEALPASPEPALSTKAAAPEPTSASEAFTRANQARREGKVKEAVRLYRVLQDRYAGSSEELVSRVALGRLLLDRSGDSRGALVQFNSYLASPGGGALREEATVGRALALGRLGRSTEERAAWQALLDSWPKSTHAKRAEARLAELGRR
jgi:TolA-binding protein